MTILLGDCLEHMKQMEDNYIDFILTDPPYGIAFMGKNWDRGIPSTEYWQEMLRICKPGSMMLCAGLPRMIHRLGCIVEDSGWEIRDMIMHLFGSGFPKSHNKFGLPGYGTALKPAWEGWILAMKPLEGTFAKNAEKWNVAGINIDDCRISSNDFEPKQRLGASKLMEDRPWNEKQLNDERNKFTEGHSLGRWPANLILSEKAAEELNQQTGNNVSRFFKIVENDLIFCRAKAIMESWKPSFANIVDENFSLPKEYFDSVLKHAVIEASQGDRQLKNIQIPFMTGTVKELKNLCISVIIMTLSIEKKYWHGSYLISMDNWKNNHVNCVEIQKLTDTTMIMTNPMNLDGFVVDVTLESTLKSQEHGEKDFQNKAFYCPKASSAERNKGLDKPSSHPTVKPIALMKYLLKLLAPPGNPIVLDPFAGSGSTLVAAKELGIRFIGIEKEPEYHAIAESRIKAIKIYEEQLELPLT